MKNNTNLIFDFDGTLVNSFHSIIKKFNLLADEFNFRRVSDDEVSHLRNLTSQELIRYLQIPLYKLPKVILKATALMRKEMQTLLPVAGLVDVLHTIHHSNINLGILTSNSEENVTAWLTHHKMRQYFNFIHVASNYFGKKHVLKKVVKSYNMDKSKTFYIGDETRDIEAANACQIQSIAVTWGFNSEKILAECHPCFIVRNPDDLLRYIT